LTRTLIATSALRDVDPPQRHLYAWLPAGQRGPPLAHLADHLVHLAADLHTVRRQHVGAGRPVASQADDHALAAGRRRLVARAGREPPPGRLDSGGVAPVPGLVAVPVISQRRTDDRGRLSVREDHGVTSYNAVPAMSAPHEQCAAPNISAHSGEWVAARPGAVSTENAPGGVESRHNACSASISLGHKLNPDRCRVSVVTEYGPAVCCVNAPAPASTHRFTAPIRISFA